MFAFPDSLVGTDADLLVLGGGVVGLAVAREGARRGLRVVLVEANSQFGMETSSRNSEVIHAGIYYPPGSLKAETCVAGRERLYAFAAERAVPVRRCGKLIVASEGGQLEALAAIARNAEANGVEDLELLDAAQVARLEPDLRAAAGLLSPSTGIVDSHAFMLALAGEAEAHGAQLICNTHATRITRQSGAWHLHIEGEPDPVLAVRSVVNAAGLCADEVARAIEGYRTDRLAPDLWAKGHYYGYAGPVPFRRLIYPLPVNGGLGIHLTLDLAGRARFGPDVTWVRHPDYSVDPGLGPVFAEAISRYWPGLDPERLHPDYAGVRPKLGGPSDPAGDFLIEDERAHGLRGIVNMLGIESPGLTASLSLADRALASLEKTEAV